MGYCMSQTDAKFSIKRENHTPALNALKALMTRDDLKTGSSGSANGPRTRHFSFCNMADVDGWANLANAMEEIRWTPTLDDDYNIVGVEFQGEKMGDDMAFFSAIAEFVEDGSFIQMRGEDGGQWRWKFSGGKCEEEHANVSWDE
jgi:hypothetical protein